MGLGSIGGLVKKATKIATGAASSLLDVAKGDPISAMKKGIESATLAAEIGEEVSVFGAVKKGSKFVFGSKCEMGAGASVGLDTVG